MGDEKLVTVSTVRTLALDMGKDQVEQKKENENICVRPYPFYHHIGTIQLLRNAIILGLIKGSHRIISGGRCCQKHYK